MSPAISSSSSAANLATLMQALSAVSPSSLSLPSDASGGQSPSITDIVSLSAAALQTQSAEMAAIQTVNAQATAVGSLFSLLG